MYNPEGRSQIFVWGIFFFGGGGGCILQNLQTRQKRRFFINTSTLWSYGEFLCGGGARVPGITKKRSETKLKQTSFFPAESKEQH